MPTIVASLLRVLIQAVVQTGILVAVQKLLDPLVDAAKDAYKNLFKLTDEEAEDTLANDVIDVLATVGIIGVSIKTKLPTKVAEKLGFTAKGYAKRKLKSTTETKIAATKGKAVDIAKTSTGKQVATLVETEELAKVVSKSRGISLSSVKSLLGIIATIVGVPTGFFFAVAQYIDFANWQGPYQKYFQNLLSYIGIEPSTPLPRASVVSDDTWKRIYATIEILKPIGLSFPFSGVDKPYSRKALAELVDEIAANIVLNKGDATYKNVIGIVLPLIQLNKEAVFPNVQIPTGTTKITVPTTSTSVKVFTGIVSQGVVGGGLEFTPRPDDLIEDANELQQAINNNVAPFLSSLLNQVVYEVRVVSSVTVNGIRKVGTTQRVQSGTYANGQPKYKMVTNKFAVADLYLRKDANTRTKITSIILGPVNATTFQPMTSDLISISAQVSKNILTSSTDDINTVVSGTPTLSVAPASSNIAISTPSIGYTFVYDGYLGAVSFNTATVDRLRKEIANGSKTVEEAMVELKTRHVKDYSAPSSIITGEDSWANQNQNVVNTAFSIAPDKIRALLTTGGTFKGTPKETRETNVSEANTNGNVQQNSQNTTGSKTLPAEALTASTLSEFYGAQGLQLPSLDERGRLYQSYGLGQAGFYTGTAEQNTKLLKTLQGKNL